MPSSLLYLLFIQERLWIGNTETMLLIYMSEQVFKFLI